MIRRFGIDVVRYGPIDTPVDFDENSVTIIKRVRPHTMTSDDKLFGLCAAARYIVRGTIEGAVVECGVWRGGSMMAVALALMGEGDTKRPLYLFDTFKGMPAPGRLDETSWGTTADVLRARTENRTREPWLSASIDEVRGAMATVGYPGPVHFVQGLVEETIPSNAPSEIALLRLDTDFYESTRHALEHLGPRIVTNGVLILDDYGYWKGARLAADEYIQKHKLNLLLNRLDEGRIAVIPSVERRG